MIKKDSTNLLTHYIIGKLKIFPEFTFVIFEFGILDKDDILYNEMLTNEDEFNFNKGFHHINKNVNFISYEKIILNEAYNLVGIIYSPTYSHLLELILICKMIIKVYYLIIIIMTIDKIII